MSLLDGTSDLSLGNYTITGSPSVSSTTSGSSTSPSISSSSGSILGTVTNFFSNLAGDYVQLTAVNKGVPITTNTGAVVQPSISPVVYIVGGIALLLILKKFVFKK